MKICTKCNTSKPDEEFFKKRGKLTSWCKQCLYDYQSMRWNRNKTILIIEKGGMCDKCGRTGHPSIFDFHHTDPNTKDFEISTMRCSSLDKLRIETQKCVLLCACCHRLEHITDKYWKFDLNAPEFKKATQHIRYCKCGSRLNYGTMMCAKCNSRSQEKIIWPENLPELVAASSKLAIAKRLGVSDKAVAKRLQNHHQI